MYSISLDGYCMSCTCAQTFMGKKLQYGTFKLLMQPGGSLACMVTMWLYDIRAAASLVALCM